MSLWMVSAGTGEQVNAKMDEASRMGRHRPDAYLKCVVNPSLDRSEPRLLLTGSWAVDRDHVRNRPIAQVNLCLGLLARRSIDMV